MLIIPFTQAAIIFFGILQLSTAAIHICWVWKRTETAGKEDDAFLKFIQSG